MTKYAFAAICLATLAYEAYALHQNQGNTISEIVWRYEFRYPLVAFLLGLIAGHLVWPSSKCIDLLK